MPAAAFTASYAAGQLARRVRVPPPRPIELPAKFGLVINGKTVKAMSLTIPPSVLTRAAEVLQ